MACMDGVVVSGLLSGFIIGTAEVLHNNGRGGGGRALVGRAVPLMAASTFATFLAVPLPTAEQRTNAVAAMVPLSLSLSFMVGDK
jgi:hypothetical protein